MVLLDGTNAGGRVWQVACRDCDYPSVGSCGRLSADMTSGLFTRVTFKVCVDQTQLGDSVFVTGNAPILGKCPCHGGHTARFPTCAVTSEGAKIMRPLRTPRRVDMWGKSASCCCGGAAVFVTDL